jgi:hypothetical protein
MEANFEMWWLDEKFHTPIRSRQRLSKASGSGNAIAGRHVAASAS